MFIALRDLRFARGRFALLGAVIGLMTLMVVLLTGLTSGLGAASVSAISALPTDQVALAAPPGQSDPQFALSALPADTVDRLRAQPGVRTARPLGISTSRLTAGDTTAAVSVFGTDDSLPPDQVRVPDSLGLAPGTEVELGGHRLIVAAAGDETSFSHLPVVHTAIDTWHKIARTDSLTGVLVDLAGDPAAIGAATGTRVLTREQAYDAVGGYAAEQGSLTMIRVLLLVVSALVVGAFFTVWTMQRTPDLAVVRAMGASRGYLLRDALGQAAVVLVLGTVTGAAAATGLGLLAREAVPFVVDSGTVLIPLALMIGVGLSGAAIAVRRVTTVDPLTALGASR
ncbi:putative ABC transport system permease protein [Actinokineospora alba]|uniref:Putative ABC transport system permease protein n=1 Tax=Actinokineospora alba TaxID=504798 RepID=A0A1H0R435_9PSEU|nr:ABC transporter permease [Actinokineospora alba]TDP70261.1 putative ABC transport system permease protein [Actinokineospora alba]SDI35515.1 putative ABC transport system permease protein [Actinokineospora alba]SDP24190.1 putative ABC transport system permease protein [Actinokineospora alba]